MMPLTIIKVCPLKCKMSKNIFSFILRKSLFYISTNDFDNDAIIPPHTDVYVEGYNKGLHSPVKLSINQIYIHGQCTYIVYCLSSNVKQIITFVSLVDKTKTPLQAKLSRFNADVHEDNI